MRRNCLAFLVFSLAGVAVSAAAVPRPQSSGSTCDWSPDFKIDNLDGFTSALLAYDDGGGSALYVGGDFSHLGGVPTDPIAKWNGSAWSGLNPLGPTGISGDVRSFAAFDDGTGPALYAGGLFDIPGAATRNSVAKWDGTSWSQLVVPTGLGFGTWVNALAVFDDGSGPALYAAGDFDRFDGTTLNHVARWTGSAWAPLAGPGGIGVDGGVFALAVHDDGGGAALYAGGYFTKAGGVTVNGIAKWNGTAWSALSGPAGTGLGGMGTPFVYALETLGPDLYVGGIFESAGGITVNNVARWNGSSWSALTGPTGTGIEGLVFSLAVGDDGSGVALYVGGAFSTAGGVPAHSIARWNGAAWSPLTGPLGEGTAGGGSPVWTLAFYDGGGGAELYAGGSFGSAGGRPLHGIARWDGGDWSGLAPPGGHGANERVHALETVAIGGTPRLYAGGQFTFAGGVPANGVVGWDGTTGSPLTGPGGNGVDGVVYALAGHDFGGGAALYAGGFFSTAGGVTVHGVARWNGTAWSPLAGPAGTGVDGGVLALASYDDGNGPALYAGGSFVTAGGVTVSGIAKWNGTSWSGLNGPMGTGVGGALPEVHALAVFDDGTGPALYVAGYFQTAGGVTANNVAKWNGSTWSALTGSSGTGTGGAAQTLAVWTDGAGPALYAGGFFTTAGGVPVGNVARWDGSDWSPLSGPAGTGVNSFVEHLEARDEGGRRSLYAGGYFSTAGGVAANKLARWDGSEWSAISTPGTVGPDSVVYSIAFFDGDGLGTSLYAGGYFRLVGDVASSRIARWPCLGAVFADGFESGDTSAWSATVP